MPCVGISVVIFGHELVCAIPDVPKKDKRIPNPIRQVFGWVVIFILYSQCFCLKQFIHNVGSCAE